MLISKRIGNWKFGILIKPFVVRVIDVYGVTTDVFSGKGEHVIFWDFISPIDVNEVIAALRQIQKQFRLGDILLFQSGYRESYRAVCLDVVKLREMVTIVRMTPFIDIAFLKWTILRRAGTIRISPKMDEKIRLIGVLRSKYRNTISLGHYKLFSSLYGYETGIPHNDIGKIRIVRYETMNLPIIQRHQLQGKPLTQRKMRLIDRIRISRFLARGVNYKKAVRVLRELLYGQNS